MAGKKILIVEDDPETRRLVRLALESAGHAVLGAENTAIGMQLFRNETPDLIILDINLPDGDGFEFCRKVRSHKSLFDTPVIMLTGEGDIEKKASGFSAGADQYLVKPVHPKEVLLWVGALFQRLAYDKEEGDVLEVGDLRVDLKSRLAHFRGQRIENLTGKEFDLLYYLVKKRPQVLSRAHILTKLWHTVAVDNLVDVHISHLRKKAPPELAARIQTLLGKGFRFLE